jgi:hypothetical protein
LKGREATAPPRRKYSAFGGFGVFLAVFVV